MSLEVRRMRHVIALADHGSFARAATALGLSQPALSRSIQSVEREVGSSLFARTSSGVEQTDSGRVFVARLRQIVQLTDDLDRDMVGERGLQSGQIHLGAGPYPAQSTLAAALARFVADYPRIVVRVMMREWDELLRRLRAREIEFFVAETSTLGGEGDLEIEVLDPHPMFILVRAGHPLAGRGPIGLAAGFAYPCVSLSRIPPRVLEPTRAAQRRSPDATTASRVFPALEFNSLDAVKRIVLGSDALMVAPLTCVEQELEAGRLVAIGSEPFLVTRYGFVKLKTQPLSAAGTRFHEYLLEAERALTEREQQLVERWRPRPAGQAAARPQAHHPGLAPARARRGPAGAAGPRKTGGR
jgi:DNA-binding transcriptional LysR family regulator